MNSVQFTNDVLYTLFNYLTIKDIILFNGTSYARFNPSTNLKFWILNQWRLVEQHKPSSPPEYCINAI